MHFVCTSYAVWLFGRQLPARKASEQLFRPSIAKASLQSSMVATNLMVYSVLQQKSQSKSKRFIDKFSRTTKNAYHVITVGAPAAHLLKFKNGGAWRIHKNLVMLQKELQEKMLRSSFGQGDAADVGDAVALGLLKLEQHQRMNLILPQGMGAALAAIWHNVTTNTSKKHHKHLKERGALIQISSLLSTQGSETGMLEDFMYTAHVLAHCRVCFKHCDTLATPIGDVYDTALFANQMEWVDRQSVVLKVPPDVEWATKLVKAFPDGSWMQIVPVLFSVGVNEMQTVAGVLGDTTLEEEANKTGLARLTRHVCDGYLAADCVCAAAIVMAYHRQIQLHLMNLVSSFQRVKEKRFVS